MRDRRKTANGVMKELAPYHIVCNLVRLAMLKAAKVQEVGVWRIRFINATRFLLSRTCSTGVL